jgi:hypothetical protein
MLVRVVIPGVSRNPYLARHEALIFLWGTDRDRVAPQPIGEDALRAMGRDEEAFFEAERTERCWHLRRRVARPAEGTDNA